MSIFTKTLSMASQKAMKQKHFTNIFKKCSIVANYYFVSLFCLDWWLKLKIICESNKLYFNRVRAPKTRAQIWYFTIGQKLINCPFHIYVASFSSISYYSNVRLISKMQIPKLMKTNASKFFWIVKIFIYFNPTCTSAKETPYWIQWIIININWLFLLYQ